jgi:hypothetical protein
LIVSGTAGEVIEAFVLEIARLTSMMGSRAGTIFRLEVAAVGKTHEAAAP